MFQLLLILIYLSFISLGLPDALLGAAWPNMYPRFGVPLSYAGIVSAIIAAGTVISSLQSERMTLRFGTGRITAMSVATTAVALIGFSLSHEFWQICLWAVPYGLGAGSVDASLNNYVALHYKSRYMSWLHCMWGVGAATGPYVMGLALTGGHGWNDGYRVIGIIQIVLTAVLIVSLPLWKKQERRPATGNVTEEKREPMPLKDVLRIRGAKEVFILFFCYCAIEQTAGLWASSYLHLFKGVDADIAAGFGSMFFIGITVGRGLSGFLTFLLDDVKMIRLGQGVMLLGIIVTLLPLGATVSLIGLILIGLGCAPIYPCVIHSTPAHFGADKSQAVIGVQMAFAYIGTLAMPPLFGVIANAAGVSLLPFYLLILLVLMTAMHEVLDRKTANKTVTE